jgi:hypothetical protein
MLACLFRTKTNSDQASMYSGGMQDWVHENALPWSILFNNFVPETGISAIFPLRWTLAVENSKVQASGGCGGHPRWLGPPGCAIAASESVWRIIGDKSWASKQSFSAGQGGAWPFTCRLLLVSALGPSVICSGASATPLQEARVKAVPRSPVLEHPVR